MMRRTVILLRRLSVVVAATAIFSVLVAPASYATWINLNRYADGTGSVSAGLYTLPYSIELERGGVIIASNTAYSGTPWLNVVPQAGDVIRTYQPPGNPKGSITFDGLPTIDDACIGSLKFSGQGPTNANYVYPVGAKPSPYPPGSINHGTYLPTTAGWYEVTLERPLQPGYIAYLGSGVIQGGNIIVSYVERTVRDCSPPPDPCARPKYGVTVKGNRQLQLKRLRKGLPLKLSTTHAGKATVSVSLRRQDRRRLKIGGSNVVGRKTLSLKGTEEKSVRIGLSSKFRNARRLGKGRVRLKVTVVGLAKGVPSWRKLERRVSVSVVVRGRGKVSKRRVTSTKDVLGISPCAKRLKVKISVLRKGSVRKGLKVRFTASGKATGKLKLVIRKRDMSRLGLSNRDVTAYIGKVSLSADKKLTKKILIKKRLASRLASALNRGKGRLLRAKLTVSAKGSDGQRTSESKTVRLG